MRDQCRQKENRMEEYDKTLDSNSRREEQEIEEKENQKLEDYGPVSYTHLTLPTIRLV